MPTTITGTDGVSQVQDGAVTATDLTSTLDLSGKAVTLPAGVGGKVLQVVQGSTSVMVSTTSGTFIDTGLSATVTPSSASSKILVFVAHNDCRVTTTDSAIPVRLVLGSSEIYRAHDNGLLNAGGNLHAFVGFNFLHSPNSTSALTYKTQFAEPYSGTAFVQADNTNSSITLMEIAG